MASRAPSDWNPPGLRFSPRASRSQQRAQPASWSASDNLFEQGGGACKGPARTHRRYSRNVRVLVALVRTLRITAYAEARADGEEPAWRPAKGESHAHGDVLSPTALRPRVAARDGLAARLMLDVAASIPPTLRIALPTPRLPRLRHRQLDTPNLPQPESAATRDSRASAEPRSRRALGTTRSPSRGRGSTTATHAATWKTSICDRHGWRERARFTFRRERRNVADQLHPVARRERLHAERTAHPHVLRGERLDALASAAAATTPSSNADQRQPYTPRTTPPSCASTTTV